MNWAVDRRTLAQVGADMCYRQQGDLGEVAATLARLHYRGKSRGLAAAKLRPLIIAAWRKLNGCQTVAEEELDTMGQALRAAGWQPILDDEGRCFWQHRRLGTTINNLGGSFATYGQATHYAYHSATFNRG